MAKMDDGTLLANIEQQERQAVGYYNSEVAAEQAQAMDYYLSKPFGTEEEGRSQVISSDVWDVVEGMTPLILEPFVSSSDVVKFKALGPDDEEAAKQESDYINWVVTSKNDNFNELVAWAKTALLQKNGIVKYWWEKSTKAKIERYYGISDDQYALMLQDMPKGTKVIEHTEIPAEENVVGPNGEMGYPSEATHDVTVRSTEEVGEAKYTVIPPEEFLIGKDARSPNPQNARFVQHRRRVTISELREMGYDVADDIADDGEDLQFSEQYQARRAEEEQGSNINDLLDPASREVLYRETFLQIDADGDGLTELMKVCAVGKTILSREETEEINFCAFTPYTQPFKFYGRCPADETIEIQQIKSTVLRQTMDNIYTINNNRVYVSDKVNMDDLLDNQIAGIVRVGGDMVQNHVRPAEVTPIGAITMPMIEYFDSAKENRTGFTRYNQGTDADSLNKTATGVRIIKQAGDVRNRLVSRSMAEQGLVPLMRGIHGLCRRHATKAETLMLRGEWVTIDPRQWKERTDMTVEVGLGNADQQMKLQAVQMLMNEQKQLLQVGVVSPANFYNGAAKMVEAVGFKNPEQFFTPADKMPPQQPPPEDPKNALEAAKIEIADKGHMLDEQRFELEKRKVDILDRDSLVNADKIEAEISLQAQAQGIDMQTQLQDAMLALQQEMRDGQKHVLDAQQQAHQQMMDKVSAQQAEQQARQQEAQEKTAESAKAEQSKADKGDDMKATLAAMLEHMKKPRQVVRDAAGKIVGMQ